MGRALRRAVPRHVRVRAVGRARGAACCSCATGSASSRSTTRVTASRRRVRLRDQGAARRSRRAARLESPRRSTPTWRCSTCPAPRDDLSRRSGSCRRGISSSPRTDSVSRAALLGPDVHRRRGSLRAKRNTSSGSTRCVTESVAPAADQRRAARRVPVRRHRLERGRRPTWSRRARAPRGHDLGRLRRRGVRRAASTRGRVAEHLGRESHEQIVTPDIVDLLPKLAWHFDEPFADSSAVPTYYVSKAARELSPSRCRATAATSSGPATRGTASSSWEQQARGGSARPAAGSPARLGRALPLARARARASLRHLALSPAEAYALKHAYGMFERTPRRGSTRTTSPPASATPIRSPRFRDAYGALPVAGSARSRAVRRRQDLPGRRHPDQGRPDEHGGVARGARAAARSQAARVRRDVLLDAVEAEDCASEDGKYICCAGCSSRRMSALARRRPKHGFDGADRRWLRGPLAPMARRAAARRPAAATAASVRERAWSPRLEASIATARAIIATGCGSW